MDSEGAGKADHRGMAFDVRGTMPASRQAGPTGTNGYGYGDSHGNGGDGDNGVGAGDGHGRPSPGPARLVPLNRSEALMRRAGRSWLGPLAMIFQSFAYNGLPVVVLFMITGFLTSPFPALMSIFEQVCFWVFRLTLILSGQYHGEATADDAWTPIFQNGGSMLMLYVITWLCWTIPVFIVVMVGNVMAGNGVGRGFARWAHAIAVVPRGWDRLARKCFGGVFRLQFKIICVLFPALVALSIICVIYSMFPVVRWGNQYGGGVLSGVGGWGVVIAIVLMTVVFILYLVIMFAWTMTTLPMAPFCIAYGLAMLQLFIQANADALARVNENLGAFRDINPAWMIPFLLILLPAPLLMWLPGALRYYANEHAIHLGFKAFATFPLAPYAPDSGYPSVRKEPARQTGR
ncbi:hypothetical protein [Bifidobacterium scardovii]|uniref:hypothetical protein n=1 Tax=Bifidobacterium scardovii TaxID=158787 RepID=UPI0011876880|nr:hypothetical protein [Bifidobacterium scardovii]MDK6349354.1 hypothetical protein [Bifidobacterium scardovii]MDU8980692.1 hypothetical protein [Bifidobacterium scardovii]